MYDPMPRKYIPAADVSSEDLQPDTVCNRESIGPFMVLLRRLRTEQITSDVQRIYFIG
jgi:hypothetical protein